VQIRADQHVNAVILCVFGGEVPTGGCLILGHLHAMSILRITVFTPRPLTSGTGPELQRANLVLEAQIVAVTLLAW
jgi:hypothetical protein